MQEEEKSQPKNVPEEVLNQSHEAQTSLQKEIIEELTKAKSSEERVKLYGQVVDTYGLDAIVSLLPLGGDAGSSLISGLYLLFEARNANLNKTDYLKIIGLQTADVFAGAIPLAGDAADYLFQANKWSAGFFEEKTEELAQKAREAGVSEADIVKITEKAEKLPKIVKKVVKGLPA